MTGIRAPSLNRQQLDRPGRCDSHRFDSFVHVIHSLRIESRPVGVSVDNHRFIHRGFVAVAEIPLIT